MLWIKNTNGKKDAVLTMATLGFFVVLLKVLFAGVIFNLDNGKTFTFGTIDGAVIAAILTPTLGAYVTRRYTDIRFVDAKESNE